MRTPSLAGLKRVQYTPQYYQFPQLSLDLHLTHGIFTRQGGVSTPPFDSLNISLSVKDRQKDVLSNIKMIKDAIGAKDLIHTNQVHGHDILVLRQNHFANSSPSLSVDAMITNIPGIALLVKQADCQGIILYDPEKQVVANVHCGWRGNVQDILGRVVARMKKEFASNASNLKAAIGPSLGPCCAEFVTYRDIFPVEFKRFMVNEHNFDLWEASCWQLKNSGLRPENIEIARICTSCRTDHFYSYRSEGNTGRFGTVAMLKDQCH